jgi:hypothetical protein
VEDNTGISLSVSDPDNMNDPQQLGDGGAADAEDYCSAELTHGDLIANFLSQSCSSTPASALAGGGSSGKVKSSGRGKSGAKNYFMLAGIMIAIVLGFAIVNGG